MGPSIGDLDVNPRIISAVKNAGFHDGRRILNLPNAELERLTGLSARDVMQLKDVISNAVLRFHAVTGLQMWKEECCERTRSPRLSTGCTLLDQALRGGLLVQGITEITGESGAGKSQLCLQLCLSVQLPLTHGGLDGGAVYICTEGAFPNKRLYQMAQEFSRQHSSVLNHAVMDHVLLEHIADLEGLRDCLQKKLRVALVRQKIKLIVVDSVTALFRCEHDSHSLVGRAKQLACVASELRGLADQHKIAVVCVNQVTANMSRTSDGPGRPRQSIPALGLVWADHITCRLLLSHPEDASSASSLLEEFHSEQGLVPSHTGSVLATKRQLEVVFAPHLAQTVVPLVITQRGVGHEGVSVGM